MLTRGQVVGHDLVFGELLMGDPGGSRTLVSGYGHMPRATMVDHDNVVAFVRAHTLQGRGIGWIDVHLLASALVGHHQLWTANAALARVARELGVAY